MLFGERKVTGYNVEGVGNDIPLEQAAVDFYRDMGKKVTAVYTQRGTYGDSTDKKDRKFSGQSDHDATTLYDVSIVVQGSLLSEQNLKDVIQEGIEEADARRSYK